MHYLFSVFRISGFLLVISLVSPNMGESGQSSTENRQLDVGSLSGDEGLSLPVLPDTIIRDDSGRVTVRAVRLVKPFLVDGKLDDEVYSRVRPMSDFIQTDPVAGAPATEQTDVWVFFDDDNIYFSARCWETQPDRIVANELRRDHRNIVQNDNIAFERIVNFPARGIGLATVEKIRAYSVENQSSLFQSSIAIVDTLPTRAANALKSFIEMIGSIDDDRAFFKEEDNKVKLKLGRYFHGLISQINKARNVKLANLDTLKKFAQEHAETVHGKAAQKAFDKISTDLKLKLPVESYYLD